MNLNDELAATNAREKIALKLLDHPVIRAVRQAGEKELRGSLRFVDPKSLAALDAASREITFAAILHAMNDPEYPEILFGELVPKELDGIAIPGARAMDDNPDTVYRFIPVDGQARYAISGRVRPDRPIVNEFSLLSEDWLTLQNLSAENLVCDRDGAFSLEIDPKPAAGRPNHIQTSAGASQILVRDTLADWSREMPILLAVHRLDPPTRAPLSEDAVVQNSIRYIHTWFTKTIALHAAAVGSPPNQFPRPEIRGTMAMLVTQAYSVGRFALEPDQAVVLTLRLGAARYAAVPVTNLWGISNDPVNRQASLNTDQAVRNEDGSFTFVLSLEDPGVANWIDPGLPQGFLFLRWAAIDPHQNGNEQPSVETVTVALSDLARHVPAAMPRLAPAERTRQLAARAQLYSRRWVGL